MSASTRCTCIQTVWLALTATAIGLSPAEAEWNRWVPGVTPALLALKSSSTVTVGAVVPLTGSLAATGRSYRDAYQFTIDTINEKGGLVVAGKNYKLSLKLINDKSNAKLSARKHERIASNRNINFLLGSYFSDEALAVSSLAEKHQVPIIHAGAASSRIFARGHKYVFGMLPASDDYFRSTIDMIGQLAPVPKTVALISGDDSFSLTLSRSTSALLKKIETQVVLDLQYSSFTPNFANILTLMQSKLPDVLLWSGNESGAIHFIRQARSRNVYPKLLAAFTEAVPTPGFRKALGDDANNAFGMTPWLPTERLKDRWFGDASQFAKMYESKFGYAPDYHSAAAAAGVEALAMAAEFAGTLDRKKVRDALAALDFQSLYGRIRFSENGQMILPLSVVQIQEGNLIEIFTDKFVNEPVLAHECSNLYAGQSDPLRRARIHDCNRPSPLRKSR